MNYFYIYCFKQHLQHFRSSYSYPDIFAGGLNTNLKYSSDYVPLIPHLWNDITICLKFPEPLARWRYMLSIFSDNILWIFTFIYILIISTIIYFFSGFESYSIDYIHIIILFTGVMTNSSIPIRKYCRRPLARILISIALTTAFLCCSVYNGKFYNLVMITRYPNELKTIEEVVARRMPFATTYEISVRKQIKFILKYSNSVFRRL